MANKYRIWPIGQEAACAAYVAAANNYYRNELGAAFDFGVMQTDRWGQPVTQLLGEPFEYPVGTPVTEPQVLLDLAGESVIAIAPDREPEV